MRFFFFLILFPALISFSQTKNEMENVQRIINQVKENYAPDKRTAIFDVSAEAKAGGILLAGETNLVKAKDKLISDLHADNIKVDNQIEVLPSKNLKDKIYGVINLSVANIRSHPAEAAELVTQAILGTPVMVYKHVKGWYLIQTPDKYLGWTGGDSFQHMNKEEFEEYQKTNKVIFLKKYGTAFSKPDANSTPVSDLVMGNILINQGKVGKFMKVKYPDKRVAYVPASEVEVFSKWLGSIKLTTKNVVDFSMQFLGIPYLWGGTSDKAFDCSGFIKTIFFMHGLILPRDASQQVFMGEPVDIKNGFQNLKPGDLLFFGNKIDSGKREKITHVALYIGNQDFINSSGRVKINSLDKNKKNFSEHRFQTFLQARRILGIKNPKDIIPLKNSIYTHGIPNFNE